MTDDLGIAPFDAADYLETEAAQLGLLNDAIASGHPAYLANALGAVARAQGGISGLARETGIKRQTLTKSLSLKGNPTLETLFPVLSKLGLTLQIVPVANDEGGSREKKLA